jgi:hypothetical protein
MTQRYVTEDISLQRVAANILNEQPQANDKVWSTSLGVAHGVTTPHHKKQACYKKS